MKELKRLAGKSISAVLTCPYSSSIVICTDGESLRIDKTGDGAEFEWIGQEEVGQWQAYQAALIRFSAAMEKLWEFNRRAMSSLPENRTVLDFGGFFCEISEHGDPILAASLEFAKKFDAAKRAAKNEKEEEGIVSRLVSSQFLTWPIEENWWKNDSTREKFLEMAAAA